MPAFKKSTRREYFESIVVAVILALFIRTWVVQAFKIPTGSMEQNLLIGDHLLVNKFVFGPTVSGLERTFLPVTQVHRGDIVVFKFPEEPERDFIKRVIGLPGETLELRQKRIFIDGEAIDEPYIGDVRQGGLATSSPLSTAAINQPCEQAFTSLDVRDNYGPVTIPPGEYFVMGDNRDNSQDSRYWGFLPRSYLKGRALVIYWSYDAQPEVARGGGVGATLRRALSVVANFFTGTRWERLLNQIR